MIIEVFLFQSQTCLNEVHFAGFRYNPLEFSSDVLNFFAKSLQNGQICLQSFAWID